MSERFRERLSILVIRASLGVGGGFLAAAFAVEAFLRGGFLIAAGISTFVLVAIISYFFAKVKPHVFSLLTLCWVILLLLLRASRI